MKNGTFLKLKKRTLLLAICLTGCWSMYHAPDVSANQSTDVMISYKNEEGKTYILKNVSKVENILDKVEMVRAIVNDQQLAKLKNNRNIEFINNSLKKMRIADDTTVKSSNPIPTYTSYWNLNYVKAPSFWKKGYVGNGVKVAVIDTGINNVPDLKNVVKRISFVKDNPETKDIDESDVWDRGGYGEGHGTSVAAVIGAQIGGKTFNNSISDIIGVAPNVQLYSLKYADGTKDGTVGEIIAAINWSIKYKMDIINISSSVYENDAALKKAIDKAVKAGIIIVASAGNEGATQPTYPARYNNVIAVSSIGKDKKISVFSNTGTSIDFVAPGDYIPTINSKGKLFYATGTSYAAPHVTGLFALLKEKYPYSSATELIQKLKTNALDLGIKGKDSKYGYGLAQLPKLYNTVPKDLSNVQITKIKDHQATITYTIPDTSSFNKVIMIIDGSKTISTTNSSSYTLKNLRENWNYKVLLKFIDKNGDSSIGVEKTFRTKEDITPPKEVNKLSSSNLKTNSVKLSWVNPKDSDFNMTEIYVNDEFVDATEYENYTVKKLKPHQEYQITLITTDQTGNASNGVYIKIHTPSAKIITKPVVNTVSTSSSSISGTAEPNSSIVVKKDSKQIATGTANKKGHFKLTIPFQALDTKLSITAGDSVSNVSEPTFVTVKQSKTTAQPIVQIVTSNTKYLRGNAELNSKVYVYRNKRLLAYDHVDPDGHFSLYIKNQPQKTILTVIVKNSLGVKSKPYKITVK
ncbi:S8 family serine peptidase [Rummeliibacillus sp. POC4]|uniref:S8 family serine peptidase n=1 Tax=Rummeliibacillus sp. POC4 TaxID=2305899 RepID=UPI0013148D6F|nr:S8 family serine peptidase [Rummeliibacillus sp. POC4]